MFKRYLWILFAMMPVGMLGTFFVAAVITYLMPKKYESHVSMEIRHTMIAGIAAAQTDPAFIPTEMGKITSRNSLMRCVDALELVGKWGMDRDSALAVLKQIVVTENLRGTNLITVRVRHTNREDARDIAGGAARAYKDYTAELESKDVEMMVNELKKAVRNQEDEVEERRMVLTTIVRVKGGDGGQGLVNDQDYIDAKREFETGLSMLEQLKLQLINQEITQGISGGTVIIHDEAVISDTPVSPDVTRNLLIGLATGLLISPFLALPLMASMHRRSMAPFLHPGSE